MVSDAIEAFALDEHELGSIGLLHHAEEECFAAGRGIALFACDNGDHGIVFFLRFARQQILQFFLAADFFNEGGRADRGLCTPLRIRVKILYHRRVNPPALFSLSLSAAMGTGLQHLCRFPER